MPKTCFRILAILTLGLAPIPALADVILYEHCDYQGYAIRLTGDGDYATRELAALGMIDDDISSIRIE